MKKNLLLSSILGCMLFAAPASADTLGFSTAVPVGEKLSLALNQNVKTTITWGDGSSEQVTFNGLEVELTVKHADFTVTTDNMITNVFCPDCSLTNIDLDNVPNLKSLICPDNQLTTLNLKNVPMLLELNCEGNELKSLSLSKCKNLESLNCAYNQLKSLPLAYQNKLQSLICSGNMLTSVSVSSMKDLQMMWCQDNKLISIGLNANSNIAQICAFNNALSELRISGMDNLEELWVDNNKIESLDLRTSPVKVLSASDNELNLIQFDEELAAGMTDFYVDNNSLMINSFPDLYDKYDQDSLMNYNISNQRPYFVTDKINVNEKMALADVLRTNAVKSIVRPAVVWETVDGVELVRNQDIKLGNYSYTFLKPFKAVRAIITTDHYKAETFYIANVEVVDPTGIEDVNVQNELGIVAKNGQIQVTVADATRIQIYNVSGVKLVDDVVSAGTNAWNLPAGLYVVNGKKVALTR